MHDLDHAEGLTTVLYFGGSNFQIGQDFRRLRPLTALNVDIVVLDYPGYGESGGTASLDAFRRAALLAYDEALAVAGDSPERLLVHGHSLGSMLAMYVADQRAVGGVILEGPATNASEWAKSFVPWYAKPFVRYNIPAALMEDDNLARIRRLQVPLLILAGREDRDTKPFMARRLNAAAGTPLERKVFVLLQGVGHMILTTSPVALESYRKFLGEQVRSHQLPSK